MRWHDEVGNKQKHGRRGHFSSALASRRSTRKAATGLRTSGYQPDGLSCAIVKPKPVRHECLTNRQADSPTYGGAGAIRFVLECVG
jgi:hypothetical protein